ncbi:MULTISPECIES: hypothetical protein [Prosthecochloris]|uniref:Uncharacterized protein n=1 Tax=Prosthecochloris vibrioformis TaxID=1098 RepID=A0A5C4S3E8_PROVB|nr:MULTISPECIES: hypothetical protein [Prosthecochloris]ANT65606.1 hypothetical protein Ptc2401_01873 [Prosthecochloris sp. CIB 2401]TNJ38013.1 hypothetical protein FGF68_02210 [Prosthecochloris vibrioformis]
MPEETPQHRLNFALVNISTDQLDINPDIYAKGKATKINAGLNFGADNERRLLKVMLTNTFFHSESEKPLPDEADNPFINITLSCVFAIDPESWDMLADTEKKQVTLPRDLAGHFASITQSTARGVLHNQTENTEFNRFMIPANNITDIIPGNVTIAFRTKD